MTALLAAEASELAQHEAVIERGLTTFFAVGRALQAIREKRLYRASHTSFEAYMRERWGMTKTRAIQLIGAAQVVENLADSAPANEAQTRSLYALTPDEQRLAWAVVQQTAPHGNITAAHVRSVVNVLKEAVQTGAIDPGTGVSVPLVADALKAAVTEETYERMRRQQQHIADSARPRHVIEYVDEHIPFPVERTPHGVRYRMPLKNGRPVLSRNFVSTVSAHMDIATFVRELVEKGCNDAVFAG